MSIKNDTTNTKTDKPASKAAEAAEAELQSPERAPEPQQPAVPQQPVLDSLSCPVNAPAPREAFRAGEAPQDRETSARK